MCSTVASEARRVELAPDDICLLGYNLQPAAKTATGSYGMYEMYEMRQLGREGAGWKHCPPYTHPLACRRLTRLHHDHDHDHPPSVLVRHSDIPLGLCCKVSRESALAWQRRWHLTRLEPRDGWIMVEWEGGSRAAHDRGRSET